MLSPKEMTGTIWNAMSVEEQLAYREFSRTIGDRLKELKQQLKEIPFNKWSEEDQTFWKTHFRPARKPKRKSSQPKENIGLKNLFAKLPSTISKANKLVSIDLEWHEFSKKITEVGVSVYNPKTKEHTTTHFIVSETLKHRNGKFVPDHKFDFKFGESKIVSLDEIESALSELVKDTDYLVGHSFGNDRMFLTQCGVMNLPPVLDTQTYAKAVLSEFKHVSLSHLTEHLGIETECLHNAGNDAHYTMKSLLALAQQ